MCIGVESEIPFMKGIRKKNLKNQTACFSLNCLPLRFLKLHSLSTNYFGGG